VSFNVVTGAYIFTQTLAISDTTKKQIVLNTLVKNDLKFSDQVRNVHVYSMDGRVIITATKIYQQLIFQHYRMANIS
jgi:hypothetical protein